MAEVEATCKKCGHKLTLLFIHAECDRCDGKLTVKHQQNFDFRGFVVLRSDMPLPRTEYIFATRADGERWRDLNGLVADVVEVESPKPFRWQPSRGTVRGIILASEMHMVFPVGTNFSSDTADNVCIIRGPS